MSKLPYVNTYQVCEGADYCLCSCSNGDPQWSVGPPASDAVFKIQKIVMAYNPGSA